MTKKRLSVLFQLFEWYDLILSSFVKLPNLAKCPKPSWSFGQLKAAWMGWGADCGLHPLIHTSASKNSPHNNGVKFSR